MPPAGNLTLPDWPQLLNWKKLEANMNRFNKEGTFKNLDPNDELVILAKMINWNNLELSFMQFYSKDIGQPGKRIRLMIGLVLLQYLYQLSDQEVIKEWKRNVYYQHFTGETSFNLNAPCDQSTLSRFKKQIGIKGANLILKETEALLAKI
jgi:IS5 family transposase